MRVVDILDGFKNRIITVVSQQKLLALLVIGGIVILGSTTVVLTKNLRKTKYQKNAAVTVTKKVPNDPSGLSTAPTNDAENQPGQIAASPTSSPTKTKKASQDNQRIPDQPDGSHSSDSSQNGQSSANSSQPTATSPVAGSPTATPTANPTPTPTLANQLPSCGSSESFFSASPVALTDFDGLVPLGNVNPSGHVFPTDHIYFFFNVNASHKLYSPGDVTITKISVSENLTQGYSDYSIEFSPCRELTVYFLHVSSLSSNLSGKFAAPFGWDSTYTTGGNSYRNYGKTVSISVNSGAQLGTVGGNPNQSSFDMGAYDTRVTLNFVNPNARLNSLHTVCPIDYYSGDLKMTLMSRFGDYDGNPKRTTLPVCGTIDQDVAGTAQGVWLAKGTTKVSSEDPHLALIHGNIYPNQAVFSIGTSMSASNLHVGYYIFYPQGSGLVNRDFDDVSSDGNIYCYEMDGQGWVEGNITILVQLPTSSSLKIERGGANTCGSGPWGFTSKAVEFER